MERGEAETVEEAYQLIMKRAKAAMEAKYGEEELSNLYVNSGVASAQKNGKYTRYPGVRYRRDTRKWRVQFNYKGKRISVGSFDTEEDAARAHDKYVKAHLLQRPLHFPESDASISV